MESLKEIFKDYARDYQLDFSDLQAFTERAHILSRLAIFDYMREKYDISPDDMALIEIYGEAGDFLKQIKLKKENQTRQLKKQYESALKSKSITELLECFFTDEQA